MEILFEHQTHASPKVSMVLLDWSCRESFHFFRYIEKQTIQRNQYEIIWIEYYNRRSTEIKEGLEDCEKLGKHPILDKWIVMDIPKNVYYHKHLMYNLGIVASRGEIVAFCDSDAIVSPTFVEAIIKSFERDRNIVLHMDEVRNTDKRFYPFNYPSIEEVIGEGCINWSNGKTTGLLERVDPLHTLNYGACMCSLREDLIAIGAADEHLDYLGHICGPYEMTFRLVNAGKKEVWHEEEFLYHVWHPGTDGRGNYLGPHDGRNMSTTALEAKRSSRIMPLVENTAIRLMRLKEVDIIYEPLIFQSIPEEEIKEWTIDNLKRRKYRIAWDTVIMHPFIMLWFLITFFRFLMKQLYIKMTKFSRSPKSAKEILKRIFRIFDFCQNMNQYYFSIVRDCSTCIGKLVSANITEFVLYGTDDVAEILYKLTLLTSTKIKTIYGDAGGKRLLNFDVAPITSIKEYRGTIVIASLTGVEAKVETLKQMGIESERIITL